MKCSSDVVTQNIYEYINLHYFRKKNLSSDFMTKARKCFKNRKYYLSES